MKRESITKKEFVGIVLPDLDPKNQGRYCVHIPELMPHFPDTRGFWVKNAIHKQRITNSDRGVYGQYLPLQPGTKVIVKFYTEDFNSGYIDRIISDEQDNNLKKPPNFDTDTNAKNRDERYILIKTPKYNNYIIINEDTDDEPNTFYIVFNKDKTGRRTVIKIDTTTGIHEYSRDNLKIRIKKDNEIQIDGNYKLTVGGNADISVNGNCNITANGDCNIKANGSVNLDGNSVNINCGNAAVASSTSVPDLE